MHTVGTRLMLEVVGFRGTLISACESRKGYIRTGGRWTRPSFNLHLYQSSDLLIKLLPYSQPPYIPILRLLTPGLRSALALRYSWLATLGLWFSTSLYGADAFACGVPCTDPRCNCVEYVKSGVWPKCPGGSAKGACDAGWTWCGPSPGSPTAPT